MHHAVNAAFIVLGIGSLAALGYWSLVLFQVLRTLVKVPTLAAGLSSEPFATHASKVGRAPRPSSNRPTPLTATPTVCVIVPAHNEEASIGVLAASLLAQDYPHFTVVFALDRCTDGTAGILARVIQQDPRCEVIQIDRCEVGWVGKVHAIERGVRDSKAARAAEVLLFVDADTSLHPSCIRAAVGLLNARHLDMLSALSTLTSDRWFEKLVQPAAGMELLHHFPIIRANDPSKGRPFANGQFIMVRRAPYESIGGHASVKFEVLEDVWLARRIAEAGFTTGLVLSGGMLHCRMYARWTEFQRGWLRIYGESASRKPQRLRRSARRVRTFGTVLPMSAGAISLWWLAAGRTTDTVQLAGALAGATALTVFIITVLLIYALARAPLWAAPAYPLGAWMVGGLLRRAAANYERNQPTIWGGREYVRPAK